MATRERDRLERRQFEQQYEAEQKAAEETRLAPIRAAEAELRRAAGKLLAAERKTALEGKEDPALVRSLLSEPMRTIRLNSLEAANEYNVRSAHAFMAATPEYYQTQANAELIANWCTRNDVLVFDAETIGNIVRYLNGLGLMEHEPEPQPEQVGEPEPGQTPIVPQTVMGRDIVTGAPREWHQSELDRLSADDYRRALDLKTQYGRLVNPVTGEWA